MLCVHGETLELTEGDVVVVWWCSDSVDSLARVHHHTLKGIHAVGQ